MAKIFVDTAKVKDYLGVKVGNKLSGNAAMIGASYESDEISEARELRDLLRDVFPLIERAATEEARANRAPTGLPKRTAMKELYERAKRALSN